MNWLRFGGTLWMASALGWFGMAIALDKLEYLGVSLACAIMAAIWNDLGNNKHDD
jgi:hypothetical protein